MALIEMTELDVRLSERIDELKWLYYELYYGDEQGFQYLCKLIRDFYEERGESLKALDRKREKDPDWYRGNDIVGMIICLVGLVLVTRASRGERRLFYFGMAVLVLAVVAEVAYASLTKALSDGYKPTVIVMYQFFIGSIFFLPLFLTRGMEHYDPDVYTGYNFWEPVLCLAILCSTVAFALWAYAIGKLGVAKSSIFQALNPVVTALAGFILGDEILCGGQWAGLAIAVGGVILTQLNLGKKNLFECKKEA